MAIIKVPSDGVLYTSALFGTGLLGFLLWRRDLLPKYMGIISIGAASFGLCSTLWQIITGRDKKARSDTDLDPLEAFYEQIASQVNEQLSRQDNPCGTEELRRHTVDETKEFDPIAYLRSGTKQPKVLEDAISSQGTFLQNCADRFKPKVPSRRETKPGKKTSDATSELAIDEDSSSGVEVETKRKLVLNISEMKLRLPKDLISDAVDSKEQECQDVKLFKEWETVYPEVEREISDFKWTEKGLKVKKILGVGRSKTGKK